MLYFHEIKPVESQSTQDTDFEKYPNRVSIIREFKTDNNLWMMSIADLMEEDIWCKEHCAGQFIFDIVITTNNGNGFGRIVARFTDIGDSIAFRLIFK